MRPYVIVTPSWCVSTGVRVLHQLCHELRGMGLEAWLLITHNLSGEGPKVHPQLNTPVLNGADFQQRWPALAQRAITVYPDGITDNPFGARHIVRYVLGKELEPPPADSGEMRLYYSRAFPAQKRATQRTLFLLPIDLALFNDLDTPPTLARGQDLLWIGKGGRHVGADRPAGREITYQWPPTRPELAEELRRTRFVYSYDTLSATNVEAILCGAVVVLKTYHYHGWTWTRQDIEATEHGAGGYAFSDSPGDIERALLTQAQFVARVREQHVRLRPQLWDFVAASQHQFR